MKSRTMKLLTPLAALAVAFGAQAFTSPQLEGFEDYSAGDAITSGENMFVFIADSGATEAADASTVTAYGESAKPTARSPRFADDGDNYLKLSVEDGRLYRSLNTPTASALGTAETVPAEGIDIDATMQFTLTDPADRPVAASGDKLVLWLEAGSETNLMVCGGRYVNGALDGTAVYKLSETVEPGSWHRVTVKALPGAEMATGGVTYSAGFTIAIDGEEATVECVDETSPFDNGYVIPSCSSSATLAGVGFAGEGKVDDIAIQNNTISVETVGDVTATATSTGYTFSVPAGYTIGSLLVDGELVAAAAGQTSYDWTGIPGASVVVAAKKTRTAPAHKWFESPYAIHTTASAGTPGFKGGKDDDYYTFTWKTSNGGYRLFNYDALSTGDNVAPISTLTTAAAKANITGYTGGNLTRGAAVSKVLGINLVMSYSPGDKMLSIPLDSTDPTNDAFVVDNDRGYAFDSGGFSPDGKYLFTNVLPDPNSGVTNTMVVKWQVLDGLRGNGVKLKYLSQLSVGDTSASRIRHAEYARIGGKDLVYCVVDDVNDIKPTANTGIKVANMTDGTVSTIAGITGLANYGSLAVSGIAGGTPHLTWGISQNLPYNATTNVNGIGNNRIAVFPLAADGLSTNGAPIVFTYADMGIPTETTHGNSVLVSDDEKTMFVVPGNGMIYAIQYAVAANTTKGKGYGTLKEAVDASTTNDTIRVLADCTVTEAITFNCGITLSNDFVVTHTVNASSIEKGYAFRFANGTNVPVTVCGTGSFVNSSGVGSAFLVGNNETYVDDTKEGKGKHDYGMDVPFAGYLIMNGCTLNGANGNVIKAEYGKFVMNGGTVTAGSNRGVKADADAGSYTVEVVINDGTITSTKAAVATSAASATATASATINGGTFTGPLTGTDITIPGTSTARFDRDQTAFCPPGYGTALADGWYVVGMITYSITYYDAEGTAFSAWADGYTAPVSFTVESPATLPLAGNLDLAETVGFNGWTNSLGEVVSGTTAGMTANLVLYADTYTITGTEPGGTVGEYDDATAATNAAQTATVAVPAAVSAIAGIDEDAYKALFTGKVTGPDAVSGLYTVTIDLTAEAAADLQAQADAGATNALANISARSITIAATPGLYYSIKSGTALDNMTESATRTLATGSEVQLDMPSLGTTGFYQVLINIVDKPQN